MSIGSVRTSVVPSPLEGVLPVRESRAGTRHRIVVNYPAVFGSTAVMICDLAEGGFQVAHRESLRIGSANRLELPAESLRGTATSANSFDVRVVWSRLNDPNTPPSYRSGLRIEKADADSRSALRRLIPQLGVADHDAFRRKRRKFEGVGAPPKVEISRESASRIQIARRYLLSHLVEAMRFYGRAKQRLTPEEIRTIEDPRASYREMTESLPIALAVWEFLGRDVPLEGITSMFENPPALDDHKPAPPRFTEIVPRSPLDPFEICR
ncbi:MAG: PilZ domain-containing protein [Acidobacteriota bacterium]